MRDAVLRRERVGAAAVACGDGADRRLADVAGGLDRGGGRDARRAEDADADRGHSPHTKGPGQRRSTDIETCSKIRGMASRRFPFPIPFGWFQVAFPERPRAGRGHAARRTGTASWCCGATTAGDFHLQDAFCPHLGAHLGLRRHRPDGELQCPFHGWRYDGEGACTNIPYSQRTNRKARLRTYPDDRAQRLRARLVPPVRRAAAVGDPGHRGDRRSRVERLLLVVVRDPHDAAGDVGERRRPRALPVRARHRRRRRDGGATTPTARAR